MLSRETIEAKDIERLTNASKDMFGFHMRYKTKKEDFLEKHIQLIESKKEELEALLEMYNFEIETESREHFIPVHKAYRQTTINILSEVNSYLDDLKQIQNKYEGDKKDGKTKDGNA